MIAIATKFIGPTNNRPSRVKATSFKGSVTVSWDHSLTVLQNHREAVRALIQKQQLSYDFPSVYGELPDGTGYTFCFKESKV